MRLNKPMWEDSHPRHQPPGFTRGNKDVVLDERGYRAEPGFSYVADLPDTPIHSITLPDKFLLFFPGGEIGLADEEGYSRIVKSSAFGIEAEDEIRGSFRYTWDGKLLFLFCKYNDGPIWVIPEDISVDTSGEPTGDINNYKFFPKAGNNPITWEDTSILNNGSLPKGTYYIAISLAFNEAAQTPYLFSAGPIVIPEDGKSITIEVSGIKTEFDKLKLTTIKLTEGQMEAWSNDVSSFRASDAFTVSSTQGDKVNIEEILVAPITYSSARDLKFSGNFLYLAGPSMDNSADLQTYANKVTVNWKPEVHGLFTGHQGEVSRGFMPDTVYAFYLVGIYPDGTRTRGFHIPGRQGTSTEKQFYSGLSGLKRFVYEDTSKGEDEDNNMAYWHNEDETYPEDFPDYSNQNVRHHKTPSRFNNDLGYSFSGLSRRINIEVTIPDMSSENIIGAEIYYAKIRNTDKLSLGTDVACIPGVGRDDSYLLNTVFNVRIDRPDAGQPGKTIYLTDPNETTNRENWRYLRGHNPFMLRETPSYGDLFIKKLFYSTESDNISIYNNNVAHFFSGIVEGSTDTLKIGSVPEIISVDTLSYFDNNSFGQVGNFQVSNINSEPCYILYLREKFRDPDASEVGRLAQAGDNTYTHGLTNLRMDPYLYSLHQAKRNVYFSYKSQELVFAGKSVTSAGGTVTLTMGNAYLSPYRFISIGPNGEDAVQEDETGIFGLISFYADSWDNPEWLRDGEGNSIVPYISSVSVPSFFDDYHEGTRVKADPVNRWSYDESFNRGNFINSVFAASTDVKYLTDFPHRVARASYTGREQRTPGFYEFLANDYFESVKSRGEITHLQPMEQNRLIIHYESGMYITRGIERLKSESGSVIEIGEGSVFSFPPSEVIYTEQGKLGTNKRVFHCLKGYAFISEGRVYLVTGEGIEDLSQRGMLSQFMDTADENVQFAYDDRYNRLIVVRDNDTLSYCFDKNKEGWVSHHSYKPDLIMSGNEVMSVKNGKLYIHNKGETLDFYGVSGEMDIGIVFSNKDQFNPHTLYFTNEGDNITKIRMSNSYQLTSEVILNPYKSFYDRGNTRKIQGKWNFGRLKDGNNKPFLDNFVEIHLIYKGKIKTYLHDVEIDVIKSVNR